MLAAGLITSRLCIESHAVSGISGATGPHGCTVTALSLSLVLMACVLSLAICSALHHTDNKA